MIFNESARPVGPSLTKGLPPSRATTALALAEASNKMYEKAKSTWRQNFAYTVTISEDDLLYPEVHRWLLSITGEERHHSLLVGTGTRFNSMVDPDESSGYKPSPLEIRFNDSAPRKVTISGHTVTVHLHTPEVVESMSGRARPSTIEFVAKTYTAQRAIIDHLEQINASRATARKAVLRMVGQWGGWRTRSDLPPRTLDSVSLPTEQKDRIVADLGEFLDAESQYNKLAIPWHRGYMFHGPPGTGKTSLVKALANEFNLDLWYVSLADLKQESSLLQLLSDVGPRSILLLEDIDTMTITHDRDSDQGTLSMGSLLNTLDGVATPHGLITVMTTNRFDILDEALTRAGRMDLIEELDWPSTRTLDDLFRHFYGEGFTSPEDINDKSIGGVSTALVAEIFKRHLTDANNARRALSELIWGSNV